MENKDIIMNNIKKIELILNAIFNKVNINEDEFVLEKQIEESLNVNIFGKNELFFNEIRNIEGLNSDNIVSFVKILEKLKIKQPNNSILYDEKIKILKDFLKERDKILYF